MLCSGAYLEMHKGDTFEQLISERDRLFAEIKDLEKIVYTEARHGDMHPGPDVVYQVELEYIAELCNFIKEKYNNEIIWNEPVKLVFAPEKWYNS